MASHHLLRRNRIVWLGIARLSGLRAPACSVRWILSRGSRFVGQSQGPDRRIRRRFRRCIMVGRLRRIARRLAAEVDGRQRRFGRRFAAAHDLRNQPGDIYARSDLAVARYTSRRVPVVGVLQCGVDVIADGGIQGPGLSQCRVAQTFGNALAEERGDVAGFGQVLELREAGEVERLAGRAFSGWRGRDVGRRRRCVAIRLFRLVLALRSSRQKIPAAAASVFVAHVRPVPSSRDPPGARSRSPPARSRRRL